MANDVRLQEGHPVDENLRPLKIGGETSSIEISKIDYGARVRGNLEITGNNETTGSSQCSGLAILEEGIVGHTGVAFDSLTGKYIVKNNGAEFSVSNSAYAGMILGYRCIGEDAAPVVYTLTTSMVTIHADATVRFIAPPSGNVEVNFQAHYYGGNGATVTLGISDNATYSALSAPSAQYEKVSFDVSRFDDAILNQNWVITGLTANDTYNYWIGAKTSSTSGSPTIKYGGDSAGENVPLIIKVTALPFAVTNFAEYG